MKKMILAGFGGQGMLLCGQLLAYAAMAEGLNVTWFPSYGPEMRGGAAACTVVVSEKPVGSPVVQFADIVVTASQPAFEKYNKSVAEGGTMLYHSAFVKITEKRDDVKYIGVDFAELTKDFPKAANVAMLGAINKLAGCASIESLRAALVYKFGNKNEKVLVINENAIAIGAEAV